MIGATGFVLTQARTEQWNGGPGTLALANLNGNDPITVIIERVGEPSQTIVLSAYGDNLTYDLKGVQSVTISAATYPAQLSLMMSTIAGMIMATAAPGSDAATVYGISNFLTSAAGSNAGSVTLTGLGGAPANVTRFWLERTILAYDYESGAAVPPVTTIWTQLDPGALGEAHTINPSMPVSVIDHGHLLLTGANPALFPFHYGGSAALVPFTFTIIFTAV